MSRLGKVPLEIPSGVKVSIDGESINVKGAKGELSAPLARGIELDISDSSVTGIKENSYLQ